MLVTYSTDSLSNLSTSASESASSGWISIIISATSRARSLKLNPLPKMHLQLLSCVVLLPQFSFVTFFIASHRRACTSLILKVVFFLATFDFTWAQIEFSSECPTDRCMHSLDIFSRPWTIFFRNILQLKILKNKHAFRLHEQDRNCVVWVKTDSSLWIFAFLQPVFGF